MSDQHENSIFYDSQKKRWPRIKYLFLITVSLLFLFMAAFLISLFAGARITDIPFSFSSIANSTCSINHSISSAKPDGLTQPKRIVFFSNKMPSKIALDENINQIDIAIGSWLHLEEGKIIETGELPTTLLRSVYSKKPDIKIIPMIDDDKDEVGLKGILSNSMLRNRMIQFLLVYVKKNNFQGIHINFQTPSIENRNNLVLFMQELTTVFSQDKLLVSMSVPANDDAFDYKQLSKIVNHMVVTLYDEHEALGEAGPIASLKWFADNLKLRVNDIPSDKLIIGLGNYGYDWNGNAPVAEKKSFLKLVEIAKKYTADIILDPISLNPTFEYKDTENNLHKVWFLDAVTAFNQISSASKSFAPMGSHYGNLAKRILHFGIYPCSFHLTLLRHRRSTLSPSIIQLNLMEMVLC